MKASIIITIIIVAVIIVGTVAYFAIDKNKFPFDRNNEFQRENFGVHPKDFQINDSAKEEITSFFGSNPQNSEIDSYCQENRMNCVYYCMEINPEEDYCKNLAPPTASDMENRTPPEGREDFQR